MIDTHLGKILKALEEQVLSCHKVAELSKAFERISARYREGKGLFLQTQEEKIAYLLTRLPGTFGAVNFVLRELQARKPQFSPQTFLDVGAGPGTGMWAAWECFPEICRYTLLEKDLPFMNLGKKMALQSEFSPIEQADWRIYDLQAPSPISDADLVLLSYSIGEIQEKFWQPLLSTLWQATKQCLVVIEPGTPAGYQRLMKIREILLSLSGHLLAPCPHSNKCPLPQGDWCHFSVRVPRTSLHRQLKSADLGYEDEKFCYMIFGKEPATAFSSRILRHPLKRSGHIEFTLCTKEGIKKQISSKKDGDFYKQAKKFEWGDCF